MKNAGINVRIAVDAAAHFAVIGQNLVWHGMNLLRIEDARDNLFRVKDKKAADELLEIAVSI